MCAAVAGSEPHWGSKQHYTAALQLTAAVGHVVKCGCGSSQQLLETCFGNWSHDEHFKMVFE